MEQQLHAPTPRVRSRRLVAAAMALMVVLGACGDDDSDSAASDAPAAASDDTNAQCLAKAEGFLADCEEPPAELPESFTPLESAPEPGGHVIKIVNGNIPSDGNSAEAQARAAEAIAWTPDGTP